MVDRTASVSGNWADAATWGGSAAPTGTQTWHINTGITVVLAADPGALTGAGDISGRLTVACDMSVASGTLGPITVNSGGKLYASRTATSFLRVVGTITSNGTNGIDYGVETTDQLSDNTKAAVIEFVCTSDSQVSRGIVLGVNNALTMCGATRVQSSTLASVAAIGANTIVLAADMVLRPGTLAQAWAGLADFILVGHTPTQTGNGTQNDEIDMYLVSGYDPVTKTVTLGDAGLGDANWPRGGVSATWNTIHQTQREIGTPVYLAGSNVIIRGSAYNLRPSSGISGNYAATVKKSFIGWCYYGIYYGSGHTVSANIISGNSIGISYGSGHTVSANTISGNSTGIYYGSGHTVSANIISGNSIGIYSGSGHTISSNTGTGNTTFLYAVGVADMRFNVFSGVEHSGYNGLDRLPWAYVQSLDHNQVVGAIKCWTRGGISTKIADPTGGNEVSWMQMAPESATYPCYYQWRYSLDPGEWIFMSARVSKSVTMNYLPRIQLIDPFADPLVDAANPVLAETVIPDDGIDTYYHVAVSYQNTSTRRIYVVARMLSMNATGTVNACVKRSPITRTIMT